MGVRLLNLGFVCGVLVAGRVLAAGGTVRPVTNGRLDVLYTVNLPCGPNDRAITRYGVVGQPAPNGSEFDPNSIICGARTRAGHQSSVSVDRPMLCDIRLEDPSNPGFPDVSTIPAIGGGTIGPTGLGADSNATPAQCSSAAAYQDYSFNSGAGISDPLVAIFLTWPFPGAGSNDPCLLGEETSAPINGHSLSYNSITSTFGALGGNHWLEAYVFTPPNISLHFRMHGSSQFPGDSGLPVWFIRSEAGWSIIDDYISASIVVDNVTNGPIGPLSLALIGNRSVINPKLAAKDFTAGFRLLSNPKVSLASGNPYTWAAGRTVLRANFPRPVNGNFQSLLPVNMPFELQLSGLSQVIRERSTLGLRPYRGYVDDGSAESSFFVQSPAQTGDVLATRFPIRRLFPRTGVNPQNTAGTGTLASQVRVTGIDVTALSTGGGGGFDAVQLRRADPIMQDSPDGSPQGVVGGRGGIGDGTADVAVDPNNPAFHVEHIGLSPITVSNADDLWVNVYTSPGDTLAAGTFLGEDQTAETVIGQSFFSKSGAQPQVFAPHRTGNWMTRLVFSRNLPPNTPGAPIGPANGVITMPVAFTASTTDPDGDRLSYTFDWGDGVMTTSPLVVSGTPVTMTHTYVSEGVCSVNVMATDECGNPSSTSSASPCDMAQTRCRCGNVECGNDPNCPSPTRVLSVNGTTGSPADYAASLSRASNPNLIVSLFRPSSNPPNSNPRFAVFLWIVQPNSSSDTMLTVNQNPIGTMCMNPRISMNCTTCPMYGVVTFPGFCNQVRCTPSFATGMPVTGSVTPVMQVPTNLIMPATTTIWIQGLIEDSLHPGTPKISVTNGVQVNLGP